MRIGPAVPGKEQAKDRGKALASLGTTAAFALAAVLYVMVSGCSKPGTALKSLATGPMAKLITPAQPTTEPDIAFTGPDGKPMKLADLKGQVVVVNLWATWCAPCKEEKPSLAKLAKAYAGRGVQVVAISVDKDTAIPKAKEFLQSHGNLAFYNDPEMRMVFGLKPLAEGLPTTLIYDKAGKEQARLSGGADWSTDQARKVMDAVLAKG